MLGHGVAAALRCDLLVLEEEPDVLEEEPDALEASQDEVAAGVAEDEAVEEVEDGVPARRVLGSVEVLLPEEDWTKKNL